MASPAVAVSRANGAVSRRSDSPVSINSAPKRKRDAADACEGQVDDDAHKSTFHGARQKNTLIRDFFLVLESLGSESHAILRRPLPVVCGGENQAKRPRVDENPAAASAASIADKVDLGVYGVLDDFISDVATAVKARLSEVESASTEDGAQRGSQAVAQATMLKNKALELFRRENTYPLVDRSRCGRAEMIAQASAIDGAALLTYGMAPVLKPLFTSLQKPTGADGKTRDLTRMDLPPGISTTRIVKAPLTADKASRTLTLGELFPSPRNLPPLQPEKAAKPVSKSDVLTFYHPELMERSKYRDKTFFTAPLSTGNWLDYSNATPITPGVTKQRERAQSLAGVKPSSTELEMSEIEALFRGAFSSFAPCKDDAGAVVSSGQVGRLWWQRAGRWTFDKMVEAEARDEGKEKEAGLAMDVDEAAIMDAIENWDDSVLDPGLDQVLGKKADQDKDVEDLLAEVSDLMETLASHQRNRNLALPTSQDRYSTDPVNGDMLRHGSVSHQPTEEEMTTYQALKAQLALIINMLPPYAVARLKSDRLEELNVSTKLEVRSDEYKGVMEEDEPARLARQAQQAQHSARERVPHRSPSVSAATGGFASHQFGTPYGQQPQRQPSVSQFPHTPVRPPGPGANQQRPPNPPAPPPHAGQQSRPPAPQPYRPSPGGYAPSLAKTQPSYGQPPLPYPNSSGQLRMGPPPPGPQGQPAYPGTQPPNARYQPSYAGFPMPHQQMPNQHSPHMQHTQQPPPPPSQPPHHQPQHMPQHSYMPYANGGQLPRTASPLIPQPHGFAQAPTIPQQQHQNMTRPPYGSPAQPMPASPAQHQPHFGPPSASPSAASHPVIIGYGPHSHMNDAAQRQMMEQANARARAQQAAAGIIQGLLKQPQQDNQHGPAANVEMQRLVAPNMQHGGSVTSPSSRMGSMHTGPSPVNGAAARPPPRPPSAASIPGSIGTPGPTSRLSPAASAMGGFSKPPA